MSAYSVAVLADNPLHYWRFNDPGGQLALDLGSSPAPLSAFLYKASIGYTGPVSDGGSFYTTNQAVFVQQDPRPIAVPLTVEGWYWQQQYVGREQKIFTTESTATPYNGLGIGIAAGGQAETFCSASALVEVGPRPLFHWYHVAATHTGAQRTLFVNGVQVAQAPNVLAGGNGVFTCGAESFTYAHYAEGFISEVAMYAGVLSGARLLAHFNAADQPTFPPTYKLFAPVGPTVPSVTFSSDLLVQILGAVRKVF